MAKAPRFRITDDCAHAGHSGHIRDGGLALADIHGRALLQVQDLVKRANAYEELIERIAELQACLAGAREKRDANREVADDFAAKIAQLRGDIAELEAVGADGDRLSIDRLNRAEAAEAKVKELEEKMNTKYWDRIREDNIKLTARIKELQGSHEQTLAGARTQARMLTERAEKAEAEAATASYTCPHCARVSPFDGEDIHSGCTFTCEHCGADSIIEPVRLGVDRGVDEGSIRHGANGA
jgi:hypothetical protein